MPEPSQTRAGWNAFDIQARKVVYQIMNVDSIAIRAMETGQRSAIRSWISQLQQLAKDTKPLWKDKADEADAQMEILRKLYRIAWSPGFRPENGEDYPLSYKARRLDLLEAINHVNGNIVNGIQDGYLYKFKTVRTGKDILRDHLKIFGKKDELEEEDARAL